MRARSIFRMGVSGLLGVFFVSIALWCSGAAAVPSGGWGTIQTVGTGTDEITLVNVGGTRYEMGNWYGWLLADQVADCWAVFSAYATANGITPAVCDAAVASMWQSAYFDTTAWNAELQGIADGCAEAGRPEITLQELQRMAVIPDISEYNCSLFAAWGAATESGETFQMRNLDWTMTAGVQDYPVVAVYHPDDGNTHAVVGYAATIGAAVGGMNVSGIGVSEIMGHFDDAETLDGIPFPVLLRDILYHDTTLSAALTRMSTVTRTNQYHYALADPSASDPKGRLLFTSNTRCDVFGDEQVINHPAESPDPYHAVLDDVVYWKNHNGSGNQLLHDAIATHYGTLDAADAMSIARTAGVSGTITSIIYHNSANEFYVAFAEDLDPAQNQEYVHFSLAESTGIGGDGYRTSVGTGVDEVPVVVTNGTAYEMGYRFGQLMQSEIQVWIPQFLAYIQSEPLMTDAALDAAWQTTAPHTDARYMEEMLGIAAGAEVDFLDVRRVHTSMLLAPYSCSSVAAWDTATVDGHLYQTRDLDWSTDAGAQDYPAIVMYMPTEGNVHVNVAFAGTVACHTGMSYAGIALAEMGDSPSGEMPYDLDGTHFMPMFREILYDANSLTDAVDILTNAQRIKRYHYVFGDGRNELAAVKIKAHAPETPPADLIIWTDNDATDEFAPNVITDVVYNDEGRGAFPAIQSNHGSIDETVMMTIATDIATSGGNVVNVVYDATDFELWVAFANDMDLAYTQPFVHLDMNTLDGDADGIMDLVEGTGDPDGDGTPNYADTDSDGDGISDAAENDATAGTDVDSDGTPNYLDTDSDGDGIDDDVENGATAGTDVDGDGTPNYLDTDSDGDGIDDDVENGTTDPYDPDDPPSTPMPHAALLAAALALMGGVLVLRRRRA
ncbi:MAG: hypothetical protein GY851_09160 [bacterium]|nr:hypothetical protein [bacterium]